MIDQWDPAFTVNDATLDGHHRKLIDRLHLLKKETTGGTDIADALKVLDAIDEHIFRHFQYEEDYLRDHGYPEVAEHKAEHEGFVAGYTAVRQRLMRGEKVELGEIILFIERWLESHFLKQDKRYADYIASQPASHPDSEAPDYHDKVHD